MKWLLRLLQENSITPVLTDWREQYVDYDCGGHQLTSVRDLDDSDSTLLVVCLEEINDLKQGINFLHELGKNRINM